MTATMASGVRREHEERVLAALRDHGARSRADLGPLVGLSRSSLSEVTSGLLERGAIVVLDKDSDVRQGAGRPADRLALDPHSGHYIGLDFQHGRVDVAIADVTQRVLGAGGSVYGLSSSWPERIQLAFELIQALAANTDVHFGSLSWIYAGVPGPFVPSYTRITLPAYAEQARFNGYGVREALVDRFDVPAVVENNTRLAAFAEANAGGVRNLVYVRLGQGVGGGLVQDGHLTRGAHSFAGELGHAIIPGLSDSCRCGKRGCLETVASLPVVIDALALAGMDVDHLVAPEHRSEPMKDGSRPRRPSLSQSDAPKLDEITARVVGALCSVLQPVVMAIDPEDVVVAGPVLPLLPDLLPLLRESLALEHFSGQEAPRVRGPLVLQYEGALGALQVGYDTQASWKGTRS